MTEEQCEQIARMYATAISNKSYAEAGAYSAVVAVIWGKDEVALVTSRGQEILKGWRER